MYLSVGQDVVLQTKDIVGVFDIDKTSVGRDTRDFLRKAEKDGRVTVAGGDIPVSFIVCGDGRVILSPYSCGTVKRHMSEATDKGLP